VIEKYKSLRMRVEIRRILLSEWDPIGIKDEPMAQDEYDRYLGDVLGLLEREAGDAEIASYLNWVSRERMGLADASGNALTPEVTVNRSVKQLKQMFLREMQVDQPDN